MKWRRFGRLYECNSLHPKLLTHSANPLPIHLGGDVYRVYFSARDIQQRSSIGAVDVDIVRRQVIREFNKPFFSYGSVDSFYSHGVSIGNTYKIGTTIYMLFMGWKNPPDAHWFGEIGRLIINPDFSLSLDSVVPFLSLDEEDSVSLSYPWVLHHDGRYKMWYGSTIEWDAGNGEMTHVIKYAESLDGHCWQKKGPAFPYELGVAQAFSRPTIWLDHADRYHMWYSYRCGSGVPYRIGYSQSEDGVNWQRTHELNNLNCHKKGWDSEMIEYPFVIEHGGRLNMFYNGNDYGRSGFGLAKAPIYCTA